MTCSLSRLAQRGDRNRCDGTLCGEDYECQSGCCGGFVSFTARRCLPIIGDYCAGRDTTRHHAGRHAHENGIELPYDREDHRFEGNLDEEESHHQREALAQHAKERLEHESFDVQDIVSELVQLQVLSQTASNEVPANG